MPAGATLGLAVLKEPAPLPAIETMADDSYCDVLAVVAQCDEPLTYTNKAGKEVTKRDRKSVV